MRIAFLLLTVALLGCAPSAVSITSDHPASSQAPIGRLAGPPPALRPGVAVTPDPAEPEPAPTGHEHHEMPSPTPAKDDPKAGPSEPKKPEPKKPEPKKTEPKKPEPKKPEPKKPEPKKPPAPAPDPHKGHEHH
jgi:colicin import membrane protein